MTIGETIRNIRQVKGLSQKNWPISAVSAWVLFQHGNKAAMSHGHAS